MLHGPYQRRQRNKMANVRGQGGVLRERLLNTLSTSCTLSARQSSLVYALDARP